MIPIEVVLAVAASLFFPAMILIVWVRRRLARRRLAKAPQESEPLVGTHDDLSDAEAESAGGPHNIRESLLQTHALIGRFSTFQGFNRTYMFELTRELEAQEIAAVVHFQETLPMGSVSVTEPHGVFELYAPRESEEAATCLVKAKIPNLNS